MVSLAMLLLGACAQSQPVVRSGADDSREEAAIRKPFWVREAALPEGFPSPGPPGQVVIKDYPAYRMAACVAGEAEGESQKTMFWPLFQHIKRNDIAMTAPVEMGYSAAVTTRPAEAARANPVSMAFLYRQPRMGNVGVDRDDSRVVVKDVPEMTVLSVGIRGNYTPQRFEKALAQLDQWLAANPGRALIAGEPRYFGYNSPMVPGFLRYGEVQVPIRRVAPVEVSCR